MDVETRRPEQLQTGRSMRFYDSTVTRKSRQVRRGSISGSDATQTCPKAAQKKLKVPEITNKIPAIEVYAHARYFCVTGLVYKQYRAIEHRETELQEFLRHHWPKAATIDDPPNEWRSDDAVVERARKYLDRVPGAVSGSGDHNATFYVACTVVKGFELSEPQALNVLNEWNSKCVPPWSEPELLHKIQSASKAGGETVYLRNAKAERWDAIRVPEYVAPKDRAADRYIPKSAWDAVAHPAKLRECVIEGLARRGEVVNCVASTKVGKSWLALGLLFSVSTGLDWLGRRVLKGNVLLLDNELHDETIQHRTAAVAQALRIQPSESHGRFDYIALRGESVNIVEIMDILSKYQPGDLTLVVLDAKYRFFTDGMQENSNDDQTTFHNAVDRLARQLDCVIVLVHHSTKGEQSTKGVTDVGSGGGSQSRAVDCHLVIRPHETPGLAVLDAAVRTFAPVDPQTIRWNFPLWSVADGVCAILKQEKTRGDNRQAASDKLGIEKMVAIFGEYEYALTRKALRTATGFGHSRVNRLLGIGVESGTFQAAGSRTVKNGEVADLFELVPQDSDEIQRGTV